MLKRIVNTQPEASQHCLIQWSHSLKWVSPGGLRWIIHCQQCVISVMSLNLFVSCRFQCRHAACVCQKVTENGHNRPWVVSPFLNWLEYDKMYINFFYVKCDKCLDFVNFSSSDKPTCDSKSPVSRTETHTSTSHPEPLSRVPWPSHLHQNTCESEVYSVFFIKIVKEILSMKI